MKKITNAIISRSFILILMVLLSSLLLVVSACDSSTSLETGTLIGRVMLVNDSGNPDLDPVDFFGVRVSLYELAQIDSVILNAKAVFNSGGFPINQNSEFDHRTHNEVAYTLSNEDGSFSISKIPYGEYNLVVRKAGWGYRYSYNVVIDADMIDYNNYNRTRETLALYPEMVIS